MLKKKEKAKHAVVDYAGTQNALNVDEDIQSEVDKFFARENAS